MPADAIIPLRAGSDHDRYLQETDMRGKPFTLNRDDGYFMGATIARVERRLGRKHGEIAQWLVWFERAPLSNRLN